MDFSTLTLYYSVSFQDENFSESFTWDVDLDNELEALYEKIVYAGDSLEGYSQFENIVEESYDEIVSYESCNLKKFVDEESMEWYSVSVSLPEEYDFEPTPEELEDFIKRMAEEKDVETIKKTVNAQEHLYTEGKDLEEFAKSVVEAEGMKY